MSRNIVVIHITSDYPPNSLWGMGIYVERLHNGLREYSDIQSYVATAKKVRVFDKTIITTEMEEDEKYLSHDKYSIFDNYNNFLIWQDFLAKHIINFIKNNNLKNIVIHSNNWMSWITAKKVSKALKIPIISSIHFLQKQYEKMIENPIEEKHLDIINIEKDMLLNSNHIICFSDESKKVVEKEYEIKRNNISIIHHTSKIEPVDQNNLKVTTDILYLGKLSYDKGILKAIDLVKKIRLTNNVNLHVIGEGELYEQIKKENLPFVKLYGYLDDPSEMKSIMVNCSFSVLFSTSDVFPISIIDSMSCGCIPILPNLDSVSKMFENEVSGFRVDEDVIGNSASIMLKLSEDKILKMRKDTLKYYEEHYSLEKMLIKTRDIYLEVLSNNK